MATPKSSLERHYQIWDDTEGVALHVGPDGDCSSYPQVCTKDKKSVEYFGEVRLVLRPDLARKLGEALIACANDLEEKP